MLGEGGPSLERAASKDAQPVPERGVDPLCLLDVLASSDDGASLRRQPPGTLVSEGELPRVGRDRDRLLEVAGRPDERMERSGPLACGTERDARQGGQRVSLRTRRRRMERREVVVGEHACELVVAEQFEVARRGHVLRPAITLGEGLVRDLADDALDEPELTALRRSRVGVEDEQLVPDEPVEACRDRGVVHLGQRTERHDGERQSEHGRVHEQRTVLRGERVEARRDERVERGRDVELREIHREREPVAVLGRLEDPAIDEHPERLDGVERHALRPLDDRRHGVLGQAADEPAEERAHVLVGQRLEVDRRGAADRRAPAGSPIEQIGARLGKDEDRRRPRPGQEVLDEVEQALVGPLEVPEDEDRRRLLGQPLEERPPCREELLA